MHLPRYTGARYVVPLREGGSLPAVVDTERDGTFVVKFRGAGQGPRARSSPRRWWRSSPTTWVFRCQSPR